MARPACIALVLVALVSLGAKSVQPDSHPKQGLIDLLMDYMAARYPGQDLHGDLLYISVQRQRLFHVRNGELIAEFAIATASNGLGSQQDTYRTPTGLHRVSEKFGDGVPPFGILRDREFTGQLADPDFSGIDKDWITARVLWLSGLEPGVNQGGEVDSHERFIYIHGTANEKSVGSPTSKGCIRMRNADVIDLYEQVPIGTLVVVLDN
ncbi:MAG: L,D-transpeptidase [Flavobacteriales bacterium]|nr:L,D-transpeptidase [Flavobacteriales bacterium]